MEEELIGLKEGIYSFGDEIVYVIDLNIGKSIRVFNLVTNEETINFISS